MPDGPGERITELPARSELFGTWQLTADSVKELQKEGFKSSLSGHARTISLRADGTCEINAYESYSVNFTNLYLSSPGMWRVNVQKEAVKYVVLTVEWGDRNSQTNWGTFDLRLAKDGGRLVFWSFMTDPDGRMYYEFAKN